MFGLSIGVGRMAAGCGGNPGALYAPGTKSAGAVGGANALGAATIGLGTLPRLVFLWPPRLLLPSICCCCHVRASFCSNCGCWICGWY
jgi:hypothetical protein